MPATPASPQRPIPILVYHQISEAPPKGAPFRSLYVSPVSFSRQMALLKLLGYQGLSMSALLPYLRGEKTGKVVGITFDDGYRNNLTHALPVLQRQGFSSTCYAVSGLLGKTNEWDQGIGMAQVPLMTADELRLWVAGGQEVGSHTQNHARLLQSDDPTALDEMTGDRAALEGLLATSVRHFCYPFGEYAPQHVAMARQAGFQTVTTTQRGRSSARNDLMELPRVPVVRSTSLAVFWLKVATAYEDRDRR
ncbi:MULTISPECIES: polysaccharide deacetylase family protein [unclassified Polaromonas]|jgi:peptidoglycan/xylan/chitin deacetylase (PgdA/CDA1 family)|uniref:polysaccharide deacetylase family protein n=1 Tax=unclassified Polaromonas TaxID=2638319 RepID=UPI000BC57ADF|nr:MULTISPECIES: polysaccharide deacetylase family protein [unclassified Polaromonas]OYY39212.1 MAG: polysaccharide deacetylase [Polaromonas sp. 35-63-35]OYZ22078.1 MAG: polysaccharide deacetylase [Polaromonas sp. 16-63-31]OYZ80517.1 MAG: polysaccharide deacetylase [Polaromonas sp. 24-63-21]OZA51578.1 MAG: polysaccharide deacetylase [Polaromonas sp. 17-63-33]OZA89949.1 MAG: polysaccharide deacetylase [Polaromonas sp. 39-63-25]